VSVDIYLGIQWGDEGKGRIVDHHASDYDVVARFGGGDNAGHTLVVGDRKIALRIVPSGVLQANTALFIGGGTVVGLAGLLAEFDMLAKLGVDLSRIRISDRAHVVFPYHAMLDRANEAARGGGAIGTTGRGIGPAYTDKVARLGITFGDLRHREALASKLRATLLAHGPQFATLETSPREEDLIAETLAAVPRVLPHVVDGAAYLHDAIDRGKRVLVEGAQGTLLDIGYGTYPYVTSSSTIAGSACTGLGIGPTRIDRVVGIAKAYATRVGAGPFPSELHDEDGERMRRNGAEFGTVTGRPRRCGWFDGVLARYAARLNGLTSVCITKLDVLGDFARIGIVTGYRLGERSAGVEAIGEAELQPVLEWHAGWMADVSGVRRIADLPEAARAYVGRLGELIDAPVESVSVGPERAALATGAPSGGRRLG